MTTNIKNEIVTSFYVNSSLIVSLHPFNAIVQLFQCNIFPTELARSCKSLSAKFFYDFPFYDD